MISVNVRSSILTTETEVVLDECWSCGNLLELGHLVIEIQLLKVVLNNEGVIEHEDTENNVFHRSCLSCALGKSEETEVETGVSLAGINGDNLNAVFPSWKEYLPEDNYWKNYPSAEY